MMTETIITIIAIIIFLHLTNTNITRIVMMNIGVAYII